MEITLKPQVFQHISHGFHLGNPKIPCGIPWKNNLTIRFLGFPGMEICGYLRFSTYMETRWKQVETPDFQGKTWAKPQKNQCKRNGISPFNAVRNYCASVFPDLETRKLLVSYKEICGKSQRNPWFLTSFPNIGTTALQFPGFLCLETKENSYITYWLDGNDMET